MSKADDLKKYEKFTSAMSGLIDSEQELERMKNLMHGGSISNEEAIFVLQGAIPHIRKAIDTMHAECNKLEDSALS